MKFQMMALYKSVQQDNANNVYVVVEEGDMPFLNPPDCGEGEDCTCEDNPKEGLLAQLLVFNTEEGAEDYMKFLVEANEMRPSQLNVVKFDLSVLWSLIEELTVVAQEEYGADGIEINLVHSTAGENFIACDTIYSQGELYN